MLAPKNHTLTYTDDGSLSLFSETFQEGCHSRSGARQETQLHYLEGCRISEKLTMSEDARILEVGFGSGLGFEMTRELAEKLKKKISFFSVEIDPALTRWSFERLNLTPQIGSIGEWEVFTASGDLFDLTVLVGNARKTLPEYLEKNGIVFDAVYQDAFSPKRNPVLWTVEWFTLLRNHSHPDATLATYSASNSIRKSLSEAGWVLRKGEAFGPKRASTRATLQGSSDEDILLQMSRSPATPIFDAHLPEELFK